MACQPKAHLGFSATDIFGEISRKIAELSCRRVLERGQTSHFEVKNAVLPARIDSRYWGLNTNFPVRDRAGKVRQIGILVVEGRSHPAEKTGGFAPHKDAGQVLASTRAARVHRPIQYGSGGELRPSDSRSRKKHRAIGTIHCSTGSAHNGCEHTCVQCSQCLPDR
jgi:hypothetical protein